ncbi:MULTISPECIES: MFS transporter [Acidobacteriaceae]|uniref:MFS transporter n=1 Tax=Acidobacteriaceae TaxID=204434 RepID=UPI00131C2F2A|nr:MULTISPECIES: MFS transporter [Acidobacteriaceae]MDW5265509.1 MFS transporter [Edaphobacter sp.]
MEEELEPVPASRSRQRQLIALLFVVAVINYFDRQSLSVVAPRFQAELHMSDEGYGHIVSLFLFASAIAYAIAGFISDALGTRRSMALFVGWWSLAEAATAFATTTLHLGIARFCLGLGEPGLWVAAPKAVGEYFERPRRGLAIGIYTMGATAGAVIALPAIAAITSHLPWRSIFLIDGAAGLLWLPFWFWCFRKDTPQPVNEEAALAEHGVSEKENEFGLRDVFAHSSTWKLMVARGLTDPVWYFYLFWFPKYLLGERGLSLAQVAHLGWAVYLAAGIGTVAGGLFSGALIQRGVSVGVSYRYTMLAAACFMPLSPLCALVSSSTLAIGIASVIAFGHMTWLVTLTATIVELYPPSLVGKAAGLVAAGSGFGGMVSSEVIAWFVTHGGYRPVFFLMAVLHPIAIVLLWRTFTNRHVRAALATA